jgi:hypothetical protein
MLISHSDLFFNYEAYLTKIFFAFTSYFSSWLISISYFEDGFDWKIILSSSSFLFFLVFFLPKWINFLKNDFFREFIYVFLLVNDDFIEESENYFKQSKSSLQNIWNAFVSISINYIFCSLKKILMKSKWIKKYIWWNSSSSWWEWKEECSIIKISQIISNNIK